MLEVPCLKLCSLHSALCRRCPSPTATALYRNMADHAAGEFTQVLFEDVVSDPTLPRRGRLPCRFSDFRVQGCQCLNRLCWWTARGEEEGMTLLFVRCNRSCGNLLVLRSSSASESSLISVRRTAADASGKGRRSRSRARRVDADTVRHLQNDSVWPAPKLP